MLAFWCGRTCLGGDLEVDDNKDRESLLSSAQVLCRFAISRNL